MYPAADFSLGAMVGQLEMTHLDLLHVVKADNIFHVAPAVDPRQLSLSVAVDDDGRTFSTGTLKYQLPLPNRPSLESDAVTRFKLSRINPC